MKIKPLKSSAKRVQDFLHQHGLDCQVKELDTSTRTVQDAAASVGCDPAQIAKSLIFKDNASGSPILIIASGKNRVNIDKVEKQIGINLSKANAEFVREKIGYAIGGVPPFAHPSPVRTILDPDLQAHPLIWAAAGTPNALFSIAPQELQRLTQGRWIELAENQTRT